PLGSGPTRRQLERPLMEAEIHHLGLGGSHGNRQDLIIPLDLRYPEPRLENIRAPGVLQVQFLDGAPVVSDNRFD
ncbi:MAG: hypothetical protein ACRD1R_02355, partial [Acidobacteriota bacterium]